jgi:hypothetical protein
MKFKIITINLLTLALVIGIISCNKNKSDLNHQDQSFEMSENGQLVYNKLVEFKHQLNSTEKSITTYSIDSAQWYAEAYYNVSSGYPDSAYSKFAVDSVTFFVPVDENNMVNMTSMTTLMMDIEAHLGSLKNQNEPESSHLVIGDVSFSITSRSSQAQVTVTSGLGIGTSWGLYVPFANEMWYYGETLGRCENPPIVPPVYSDAGEELQWRFNSPNPVYVPYPACLRGSVKVISSDVIWKTGKDNPLIYSEWKAGAYDAPCHDSPYWNGYLNNGATVFYGNVAAGGVVPDGYNYFTSVDIFTFHELKNNDSGVEGYLYYHAYNTFYAIYECIGNIN